VFCHETLYNCPGCQSLSEETKQKTKSSQVVRGKRKKRPDVAAVNGVESGASTADVMVVD
jgi:hypothetical protein